MLERLRHGTDVRSRKVRRIKAAIRVRHYENALKLAVALERMTRAAKRLRA
jgi:predicted alpha-1,6-mannanase (GH76 family)